MHVCACVYTYFHVYPRLYVVGGTGGRFCIEHKGETAAYDIGRATSDLPRRTLRMTIALNKFSIGSAVRCSALELCGLDKS